ncbi:hypothetical protein ACIBEJ_34170 [Nonomuraea sp. NPDC050790]|uniref:hypothetical protein n=1 Tax=Nonomuraea sp. NPDC050790 TaxID=3364371 RepID=UPI0037B20D31
MHDVSDVRTQRQPEPQHQPWCANHIPGEHGPGTCMSDDLVLPGQILALIAGPDSDIRIHLCTGDSIEVAEIDDIEQRGHALLAYVAMARAHTATRCA